MLLLPSLLLNHTRLLGPSLSLAASNAPTHATRNLSDEVHSINALTIHPWSLAHGKDLLEQTKYSQNKRNSM